jgi:outer membrane lipoprotein
MQTYDGWYNNIKLIQRLYMRHLLLVIISSVLFSAGCTTIISEQSRKLIDTNDSFKIIKQSPDVYIGKHVMLGGRIANVKNSADGAQLEIVQFDLSPSGYPEDTFISYGRFLAQNGSFMDPLVFRKGMLITLVGEIKGKKTLRLEDIDYTYPVLTMREWYLWREPDLRYVYPSMQPTYDPYSYGFGVEPFLQRPYSPVLVPR